MAAKAAVVMALFLACTLDRAWTPTGAARTMTMMMVQRGEVSAVVAVNGGGGGGGERGNNGGAQPEQRKEFVGMAAFTRSLAVAPLPPPSVHGDREVPSGPDPIHHGASPSSASP
ncbi:hypothetical protein OsJ_21565 [Oryza sativa Japonica Group]|uniref:Uncharacterized protein n=1 Tax=Oryza sativa subsp. japonica TaxID=39947 RepID=A3BCD8_ORYSJ|nr:hypothetical protein OsJ_21565 [Oryza sativa Japonica Group]